MSANRRSGRPPQQAIPTSLPVQTTSSVTGNGTNVPITLINDVAAPSVNRYYGSGPAGVKGYWPFPAAVTGDFWRSGINVLPDGSNDTTEVAYRDGKVVIGKSTLTDPEQLSVSGTEDTLRIENKNTGFAADAIQTAINFVGRYWSGAATAIAQAKIRIEKQAADGSAGARMVFGTAAPTNTVVDRLTLQSTGQLKFHGYTAASSFTGTAVAGLGYDNQGNVIAVPVGAGATTNTLTVGPTGTLLSTVNGTLATALPIPTFFLDTANAGPNNSGDHTDSIYRGVGSKTGFGGVPVSTLESQGSFGTNIVGGASATYNVSDTDSTVWRAPASTAYALTAASAANNRRIITLVNAIGNAWTGTAYTNLFGQVITSVPQNASVTLQSDGSVWRQIDGSDIAQQLTNATVIAMSPMLAPVGTVVPFDGFEIRWNQNLNSTYDAIELRVASGTRQVRYSQFEMYAAGSLYDQAGSIWANQEYWETSATGAAASNATYPHVKTLGTTFEIMGNHGLFQHDMRYVLLYDITNGQRYRIQITKKASTGELGAQIGSCDIWVEKIGLTAVTPLSANNGIEIVGATIGNANERSAIAPLASAQAGTTITLGELRFRYATNAINGNLEVQAVSAATPARWYGSEKFLGSAFNQFNVDLTFATATFTTLASGGLGAGEILQYYIVTANNRYDVTLSIFGSTNVVITVKKAI